MLFLQLLLLPLLLLLLLLIFFEKVFDFLKLDMLISNKKKIVKKRKNRFCKKFYNKNLAIDKSENTRVVNNNIIDFFVNSKNNNCSFCDEMNSQDVFTISIDVGYKNFCMAINEINYCIIVNFSDLNFFYKNLSILIDTIFKPKINGHKKFTFLIESQHVAINNAQQNFLHGVLSVLFQNDGVTENRIIIVTCGDKKKWFLDKYQFDYQKVKTKKLLKKIQSDHIKMWSDFFLGWRFIHVDTGKGKECLQKCVRHGDEIVKIFNKYDDFLDSRFLFFKYTHLNT